MTRRSRYFATVVLVTILSGCAAPPPTSVPTLTDSAPTLSPSPTPEPDRPEPLLDLACPDFASAGTASQFVGTDVSPFDGNAGPGFSRAMMIQQLGGITCTWNDGRTQVNDGTTRELTVTVMPEADDKWARYAEAYGIAGDEFRYCYARADFICGYFALVNGAWIESYLHGIRPASVAADADAAMVEYVKPLFDETSAAVLTASSTGDTWVASALPLPSECAAFVAPAEIAAIAGVAGGLESFTFTDGPQVDQTLGMDGKRLVTSCSWLYPGSDSGIGGMAVLPGGAWAWDEGAESLSATPMTLEGLPDDHVAYYQCWEEWRCELNFLLDGNWFELALHEGDPEYGVPFAADQPDVLVAIAERIIANLG